MMMILLTSISFEAFSRSIAAQELTFYLAAVVLVALTVESCIRLLNRDSFGIAIGVYVTVFAWYFVDPFLNPEQYDYLPSSSLSQSYGQVLLFLIGFRFFLPVAVRWIVRVSEANHGGCDFWTNVIGEYTNGALTQTTRPGSPNGWRVFSFNSRKRDAAL